MCMQRSSLPRTLFGLATSLAISIRALLHECCCIICQLVLPSDSVGIVRPSWQYETEDAPLNGG
jgi:hypothetical protein